METTERGRAVRVNAGTTVHVWDFEASVSDEWLIDGEVAECDFRVKEEFTSPTHEDTDPHLVLIQPGFEHEYEIRVRACDVTEVEREEPQGDLARTLTYLASAAAVAKRRNPLRFRRNTPKS